MVCAGWFDVCLLHADPLRSMTALVLLKSRFWLAHRNGRVACECGVPMTSGNPYRKGSPSWTAFNKTYGHTASADTHRMAKTPKIGLVRSMGSAVAPKAGDAQ